MKYIQKELSKFFTSDEGEALIGQIVLNAINMGMVREVRIEDGKSDPGRVVEKTVKVNALDFLMKYIPNVEAAIRGCQSDSAQARNRSSQALEALNKIPVLHLAEGVTEKLKELSK